MNGEASDPWSRAEIRRRLAAGPAVRPLRGDTAPAAHIHATHIPAAVLVPLVEHASGFTILFTQRNAALKAHGGQISFPGGRLEPEDADAVSAALRESREEIGLEPGAVEVLGRLDPYVTITGFEVTPIVGAVRPPLSLRADPVEVADIFEVPLSFFLDPANHQRHSRTAGGVARAYDAMPYGDRYIWGATAGMLMNLYDMLTAAGAGRIMEGR